jgi:hypothetical protein
MDELRVTTSTINLCFNSCILLEEGKREARGTNKKSIHNTKYKSQYDIHHLLEVFSLLYSRWLLEISIFQPFAPFYTETTGFHI